MLNILNVLKLEDNLYYFDAIESIKESMNGGSKIIAVEKETAPYERHLVLLHHPNSSFVEFVEFGDMDGPYYFETNINISFLEKMVETYSFILPFKAPYEK
jgi:hypothetical protein